MKKILVAYFFGKTLIPFATSGGSGIGGAQKSMREHCPEAERERRSIIIFRQRKKFFSPCFRKNMRRGYSIWKK